MNTLHNKKSSRIRRMLKMRNTLKQSVVMRLIVHRTSRHIYAQIFDMKTASVLASASTLESSIQKQLGTYTGNKKSASFIGEIIALRALKKGIEYVVFDRSGFKYHGRVQILAESARKSGLKF